LIIFAIPKIMTSRNIIDIYEISVFVTYIVIR